MIKKKHLLLTVLLLTAVVILMSRMGRAENALSEGSVAAPQQASMAGTAAKKTQADLLHVRYDGPLRLTVLKRRAYRVWYSQELRQPYAVAWHLTAQHTSGSYKRKGQQFQPDPEAPQPRVTTYDYVQSGYDRGHMCPSGDNKWDATAQQQSFLLTNVCPQNHNLNAGDWNDLEMLCRTWAHRYGDVYIVCGPVLRGDSHRRIGKSRVVVPDAFYKVVLRTGKKPAAIGFVYENRGKHQPIEDAFCTVADVEALTGLDFFSALDDKTERRIEAEADLNDW